MEQNKEEAKSNELDSHYDLMKVKVANKQRQINNQGTIIEALLNNIAQQLTISAIFSIKFVKLLGLQIPKL